MKARILALGLAVALAASAALVGAQRGRHAAGGAATSGPAPLPSEERWRRVLDQWETGDYPSALGGLIGLIESPDGADYLDRIALLTGELFTTTEVTTDGRNPRISADGRYVSFETGPTVSAATRVLRMTGSMPQPVADLHGLGAAFDPEGRRVVYLRPPRTGEWTAAASALDAAATTQARQAAQAVLNTVLGRGDLVVRDLDLGTEQIVPTGPLLKASPMFQPGGSAIVFLGADPADLSRSEIYVADQSGATARLTDQPGFKTSIQIDPAGRALLFTVTTTATFAQAGVGRGRGAGAGGAGAAGAGRAAAPAPGNPAPPAAAAPAGPNPCGGGGGRGAAAGAGPAFGIVNLVAKTTRIVTGSGVTMSADGSTIAWLARAGNVCALHVAPPLDERTPLPLLTAARLDAPALSPDGSRVAYQSMAPAGVDWELFVAGRDTRPVRVTREIQHDVQPRFLGADALLGLKGEPRHRRSYVYDLRPGAPPAPIRLFANNTLRTISPEYAWMASADGSRVLIQAERDGNTISGDRGIYVVDRARRVTAGELLARLRRQLAEETALRARTSAALSPLAPLIRRTVDGISAGRAYAYGKAMFDMDSKHVSQPGNGRAIEYLQRTYASFGYLPELQWLEARQGQGPAYRTANVVSTLKGTTSPDVIYVIGSHFDSVAAGPGADDDTSGTVALLETARVLARTPLPATVVFASFTGEESGLLGSREFVRLATERKWRVVGALNNDMIGWAGEGARLDNTIRYGNAGIRDLQHGAAILFSRLVTYDAKYYRGTDANSFFDAWGEMFGGIGSHPILGNPNYHQASDSIETINFQQVAETAKVTAATIIALASSPSPVKDVRATAGASGTTVAWTPAPETDVRSYVVEYGGESRGARPARIRVTAPRTTLPALAAGTTVRVKAVNARGLEGWDWATTSVEASRRPE